MIIMLLISFSTISLEHSDSADSPDSVDSVWVFNDFPGALWFAWFAWLSFSFQRFPRNTLIRLIHLIRLIPFESTHLEGFQGSAGGVLSGEPARCLWEGGILSHLISRGKVCTVSQALSETQTRNTFIQLAWFWVTRRNTLVRLIWFDSVWVA